MVVSFHFWHLRSHHVVDSHILLVTACRCLFCSDVFIQFVWVATGYGPTNSYKFYAMVNDIVTPKPEVIYHDEPSCNS